MNMKVMAVGAAAALMLGSAASAQTPYSSKPKADNDPSKLVCQKVEEVGSRLAKRKVCLTAEQWKEKHREHAEFTDEIQSGAWGQQSDPAVEMKIPGGPQ